MIVKVISIKQPWAWCIFNAGKNVENRTWATKYRGEIYIHASRKFDMYGYKSLNDNYDILKYTHIFEKGAIIGGAIIGKVNIVNCVINYQSDWAINSYVPWETIWWNFVLENPVPIEPIFCKGKLGIYNFNLIEI